MFQIALVTNEHDNDVRVGVVSEFLEPSSDVDVGGLLGNVVDQESSNRSSVVTDWSRCRMDNEVRIQSERGRAVWARSMCGPKTRNDAMRG